VSEVAALSRQLVERSFAVMPGRYDLGKVERIRARIEAVHHSLGTPPLWSKQPITLEDGVEICGTGLVIHELLGRAPELSADVLESDVVEVIRGALGVDMQLEFAGAVICDHTRPFFEWHNHVGGIDDELVRRRGLRPAIEPAQRVAMLVYLDEMGPGTGQLLVHPHRLGGAAPPPQPVQRLHWEGQVEVQGPAGTVVLLDQTTWHAVLPRTIDRRLRCFFGLWFASASAPPSERVDASLVELDVDDPLLRSLLPRGRDA
jgi:hypothetical protein